VKSTQIDRCQFLLSSQINYTLTYHAEHHPHFTHDAIKRYLQDEKLTVRLVWESTRMQLALSPNGYLVFDDPVADKNYSFNIGLVRPQ
jgi:hypothetical protein